MRKTIILTLIAATFLSLGTALAQNDKGKVPFYEVVPKHEFFFEGFGGLLRYLEIYETKDKYKIIATVQKIVL